MGRGHARFGQQQRLRTQADYQRVFQQAHRSADDYLLVLMRPNQAQRARLGLAIARRKIPSAVARNRVKRLIRESFRHHKQHLTGLDIIVLARTDLSHVPNQVLFHSLAKHWARHGSRRG